MATDRASLLALPRLPSIIRSVKSPFTTPSSSDTSRPPTPPPSYTAATDSIQWKYANQGLSLLNLSAAESTSAETPFARQLYIHALTYLLRALPPLTEEETASLSAALPEQLQPGSPVTYPAETPPGKKTWLHRLAACLTLQAFLLAALLLPLLQQCVTVAVRVNRTYALSDRALASAVVGLAWAGSAAGTVWRLQDGRVGRVFEALAAAVSAGVYDGVGEGMAAYGLREEERTIRRERSGSVYEARPGVAGMKARELRKVRSFDVGRRETGSPRKRCGW